MESQPKDTIECTEITGDDVEAALRDLGTYVDISPDDLKALCASAITHARQRTAQSEAVRGLMTTRIISVKRGADIHEASRLLSENRISGLPVVDDDALVVGVITEKDVLAMTGIDRGHTMKDLIKHLLGEPLPRRHGGRLVDDFMSSPAITVQPDIDIRQAAAIMNERGIKRLIVVDSDGALVGIIARADIVRAVGGK